MEREYITLSLEKNQKEKLIEKADERNLTLKQYLKILIINL